MKDLKFSAAFLLAFILTVRASRIPRDKAHESVMKLKKAYAKKNAPADTVSDSVSLQATVVNGLYTVCNYQYGGTTTYASFSTYSGSRDYYGPIALNSCRQIPFNDTDNTYLTASQDTAGSTITIDRDSLSSSSFCSSNFDLNLAVLTPGSIGFRANAISDSPTCSLASGTDGRITVGHAGEYTTAVVYYSSPSTSDSLPDGNVLLYPGTSTASWDMAAGTYYSFLNYKHDNTETCRKCTWTIASGSGASAYAFMYQTGAFTGEAGTTVQGSGMTVTCVSTNDCVDYFSGSDNNNNVCFHGDELVHLASGKDLPIKDLKLGDEIKVAAQDGTFSFSKVVFLPHKRNLQQAKFISLETLSKHHLKVTPEHLLPVFDGCREDVHSSMKKARDVMLGDCLLTAQGKSKVVGVELVEGYGIYTAVAKHPDGQIVVNGIVASSFGTVHTITNWYYHIHRALDTIFPEWKLDSNVMTAGNQYIGGVALGFLSLLHPFLPKY
mmetsp:Transcript_41991/g.68171  ORF Transcript_41991/g.68171 Transcript_41991/m.68171 type:complete len:495 (-) Transcript_41991:300-1784(-)